MEYFGTSFSEHGHYRWDISNGNFTYKSLTFKDLPFNPEGLTNNLPKGSVVYYQGGGFTVIGISGSCKDDRGGTKSIFWLKGNYSREDMIFKVQANPIAAKIIERMSFKIEW